VRSIAELHAEESLPTLVFRMVNVLEPPCDIGSTSRGAVDVSLKARAMAKFIFTREP
jgi:hypothetical protein